MLLTVKVAYDTVVNESVLITASDSLIRSLVYELDVRNGLIVGTDTRDLPRQARVMARRRTQRMETIRYPRVKIDHETANLFNFASQATDNPPLAFLSYYQTLEYFIPTAVRQSAFKKIRRELQDPTFDQERDSCLLRIVATAEQLVAVSESHQFRTLVREYVRPDRLQEFFALDWGHYFSKRGPIQGVEHINLQNVSKDICDQVADRIYQIRNRIVHAKDDPRYEQTRVLLPRSQEAEALGPDVQLVRLLATEAISCAQAG